MTDQPGRVPVPGGSQGEPERQLPVPRPPSEAAPAERFTAPPTAHALSLSPERVSEIVRQSGSARWVSFLAVLIVVVFVILYYFYDLGIPGLPGTSRLTAETEAQAITAVENGYNIFQANCARCHGVNGEGGIGPVLNDQMKLYNHLNPAYIRTVLYSGGRYVCGNPNSLMPVWDQSNGGPLNYVQIDQLIAFLRAPNNQEFVVRDPSTKEPVTDATGKEETFTGWRDPNFAPAPNATPVPACWTDAFKTPPSPGASGSPGAPASAGASGPASGTVIDETAQNIAFTVPDLSAPAGQAFTIAFDNEDAGTPHNIEIKDANGQSVFKGDIFPGVAKQNYNVPALQAGAYTFVCDVHPSMTGTLTVK